MTSARGADRDASGDSREAPKPKPPVPSKAATDDVPVAPVVPNAVPPVAPPAQPVPPAQPSVPPVVAKPVEPAPAEAEPEAARSADPDSEGERLKKPTTKISKEHLEFSAAHSVLAKIEERSGELPRITLQDTPSEPSPLVLPGAQTSPPDRALDHYDIVGEIGRGAMGSILKARDVDIGRDVAIKLLRKDLGKRPELSQRFIEEAQISGQLQHPSIAPLYEIGAHPDGRPYFAMKLIKGRTLSGLLNQRSGPQQGRHRFLGIFEQICQAMAYAHSRGVIHRDLKPSNIMVGAFGEVQVMDWGFAKVLGRGGLADEREAHRIQSVISVIETVRQDDDEVGSRSLAGSLMGTPPYMPPEQASGHIDLVDTRSDTFALGAVLCEILTGKPPYVLENPEAGISEIIQKAARAQLEPAYQRLDTCGADEDLIRICKSCLTPAQAARPSDAGQLTREITGYLQAVEERARKSQLAAVAERGRAQTAHARAAAAAREAEQAKRARRLTLALGTAVLVAVLLGGGGFFMVQNQRKEQEAQTVRDVARDMEEAARLRGLAVADATGDLSHWTAALTAAKSAKERAESGEASPELLARAGETLQEIETEAEEARLVAEQKEKDHAVVARLESIRAQKGDDFDPHRSEAQYAEAFQAYGIDIDRGSPRDVANRIAASAVATPLIEALDEWAWVRAYGTVPEGSRDRPAELARMADDDSWRGKLRRAIAQGDESRLVRLAREGDPAEHGATSAHLMASALANIGKHEEAAEYLRRARFHHTADLWINFYLGYWSTQLVPPDWEGAARAYSAAVAVRPEGAAGWNNLGIALQSLGRTKEAIRAYERAIALQEGYASAWNNLGTVYLERRKDQKALDAFQQAVAVQPDHALAHFGLGTTYQRLGDTDKALEAYEAALRFRPDLREAHDAMTSMLTGRGRGAEALEIAKKARDSNPMAAWAHRNYAYTLWAQNRRAAALKHYEKALQLDPNDPVALHDYGVARGWSGSWDQAIKYIALACEKDPRESLYRSDLGWAYEAKGDLDRAAREFRHALDLDPQLFVAIDQLGSVLWRQGDREGAAATFVRGIRADPYHGTLYGYTNLGQLLGQRISQPDAEAFYEREIEEDTTEGRIAFQVGLASQLIQIQRDYEGALAAIETAKKRQTDNASVLDAESQILRLLGDPDGAVRAARAAIRVDPSLPMPHCDLAFALQLKGRFADAVDAMQKGHERGLRLRWQQPSQAWLALAERYVEIHDALGDYLKGDKEPADVQEALQLAWVCRCTRRWATAAGVYDDVLANDEYPQANRDAIRYTAACAAARAGTLLGRSNDAKRPSTEERKALRGRALAWLQVELDRMRTQIEATPDPRALQSVVRRWLVEPDLAGVRNTDRLQSLEPDERAAFSKLWDEVSAVAGE